MAAIKDCLPSWMCQAMPSKINETLINDLWGLALDVRKEEVEKLTDTNQQFFSCLK